MDISRLLLSETQRSDALRMVAKRLVDVSGADYVAIGLSNPAYPEGTGFFEAVAGTLGVDHVSGRLSPKQGLTAKVVATGVPVVSRNITEEEGYNPPPEVAEAMSVLGLGMYLPLRAAGRVFGILVAGWRRGSPHEDVAANEVPMMEMFAGQAALTIQQVQARLMVVEDRDRIAKELSTTVIDRLFAIGTHLHGIAGLVQPHEAQHLMGHAIDGLDDATQQIRSAIFALHPDTSGQQQSASDKVLDEVDVAAATFGFTPRFVVEGPVDRSLGPLPQQELVRAVREALSHAASHRNVTKAEVIVRVTDDRIALTVRDDGEVDERQPIEGALAQLRSRARRLGGECSVRSGGSSGTVTFWELPLSGESRGSGRTLG
ncbi:GAF domain-containing sensor histidine kinase [Actinopolymorpha pittospori]